jgi:hypothetical protein
VKRLFNHSATSMSYTVSSHTGTGNRQLCLTFVFWTCRDMGCTLSRKSFVVSSIEGQVCWLDCTACLSTSNKFVTVRWLHAQDDSAVEVFQVLGLTKQDIDLLFTAFWDIDADSSGSTAIYSFVSM